MPVLPRHPLTRRKSDQRLVCDGGAVSHTDKIETLPECGYGNRDDPDGWVRTEVSGGLLAFYGVCRACFPNLDQDVKPDELREELDGREIVRRTGKCATQVHRPRDGSEIDRGDGVIADGGDQVMYQVDVHLLNGEDLGSIVVPQVPVEGDKIRTSDGVIYRVRERTWLLANSISYDSVASLTVEPAGSDSDALDRGDGPRTDGGFGDPPGPADRPGAFSATWVDDPVPREEYGDDPTAAREGHVRDRVLDPDDPLDVEDLAPINSTAERLSVRLGDDHARDLDAVLEEVDGIENRSQALRLGIRLLADVLEGETDLVDPFGPLLEADHHLRQALDRDTPAEIRYHVREAASLLDAVGRVDP